jgi:hypothetical protein
MINLADFNFLDPKTGIVSSMPILEASTVYFKARGLLWRRNSEEVKLLASDADGIIDSYFDQERADLIEEIKTDKRFELLETDCDGDVRGIRDEAIEEYDVYNRETTSDLDALANAIDHFFDPVSIPEIKDPEPFELFAAVALNYLAAYNKKTKIKLDLKTLSWVPRTSADYSASEVASMSSVVFDAMEMANYSESLRKQQSLEDKFQERMNQLRSQQTDAVQAQIEKIRVETLEASREEDKKARSLRAQENNKVRHKKNHEAKKLVTEQWAAEPFRFISLESAGEHFVNVLEAQGYGLKQRTVVKWLSDKAREMNVRFSTRR